jgi:ureidoacrylate peracid hydrolase
MEVLRDFGQRVSPAHTAILVIDMQNDFCAEGGYIHKTRNADMSANGPLAERVSALVDAGRRAGAAIVWVQANYEPRYLSGQAILKREERPGGLVCCEGGSWGWQFYKVQPVEGELMIEKHCFSAFFGTELDRMLRFRGIKTLVFTGVATNTCVESSLRDASFLGYYIVLAEDCCASSAPKLHDATLDNVRASFGDVVSSSRVRESWNAKASRA